VPSYGGGDWPSRHITFIVPKNFNFFSCSIHGVWGEGGRRLAEKMSYGGKVG